MNQNFMFLMIFPTWSPVLNIFIKLFISGFKESVSFFVLFIWHRKRDNLETHERWSTLGRTESLKHPWNGVFVETLVISIVLHWLSILLAIFPAFQPFFPLFHSSWLHFSGYYFQITNTFTYSSCFFLETRKNFLLILKFISFWLTIRCNFMIILFIMCTN